MDETPSHINARKMKSGKEFFLFLGVALLFLGVLTGPFVVRGALWTDELFSLTTAEEPLGSMLDNLRRYQPGYFDHPPLYFLLLRCVLLFDNSPLALRFPSLMATALLLGCLGMFLRSRWEDTRWPLVAVALFAFHPLVREMAHFVRMYACFLLVAGLLFFCLWAMAEGEIPRWKCGVGLAVAFAVSLYLSYFALMLGIGLAALTLLWIARPTTAALRDRTPGLWTLGGLAGGAVLFLPWLPVVFRLFGAETASDGKASVPAEGFLWAARGRELVGVIVELGGGWSMPLVLLGWLGLSRFDRDRRRWLAFLAAFLVVPVSVLLVLSPPDRPVAARYAIFSLPVLLLGAASGCRAFLANWRSKAGAWFPKAIVIALAILAVGGGTGQARKTYLHIEPSWWAVAEILESQATPDEIILTGGYLSGEAVVYHMRNPEKFKFLHYVTAMDPFYLANRNPGVRWFVNGAYLPPAYEAIVHRYFPWRASIATNDSVSPVVTVACKRPFRLPDGTEAPYHTPVPLPYERTDEE